MFATPWHSISFILGMLLVYISGKWIAKKLMYIKFPWGLVVGIVVVHFLVGYLLVSQVINLEF